MDKENETPAGDEWEVLGHEPVPGYRKAFHIVVLASLLYLVYIFGSSL